MKKYFKKSKLFIFGILGLASVAIVTLPTFILTSCSKNKNTTDNGGSQNKPGGGDNTNKPDGGGSDPVTPPNPSINKVQSLTTAKIDTLDGNYFFSSYNNTNFDNWTKDEVQSAFGELTTEEANGRVSTVVSQSKKETLEVVLKEKFTKEFVLENKKVYTQEDTKVNFSNLLWSGVLHSEGCYLKVDFRFVNDKVDQVMFLIWLKENYTWTNDWDKFKKPTDGIALQGWNNTVFPSLGINEGDPSHFIFVARKQAL